MKLWLTTGSLELAVIRAETELDARMLKRQAFSEIGFSGEEYLDPDEYACVEITPEGEPGIIAEYSG